jgi:hypothetical protein
MSPYRRSADIAGTSHTGQPLGLDAFAADPGGLNPARRRSNGRAIFPCAVDAPCVPIHNHISYFAVRQRLSAIRSAARAPPHSPPSALVDLASHASAPDSPVDTPLPVPPRSPVLPPPAPSPALPPASRATAAPFPKLNLRLRKAQPRPTRPVASGVRSARPRAQA